MSYLEQGFFQLIFRDMRKWVHVVSHITIYLSLACTLFMNDISLTHWDWDKMVVISQTTVDNKILLNKNICILIKISLNFVPKGPINNIPALVQIIAWRRPGVKPLSEPMKVKLPMQICITRPQLVHSNSVEITFCSHSSYCEVIAMKFCIWHMQILYWYVALQWNHTKNKLSVEFELRWKSMHQMSSWSAWLYLGCDFMGILLNENILISKEI